ncbi:pimeloyl-ACP methyl ester carboxylesterase [Rhodococcus rhodochrous J45]|uniref:Pimeloyl-ACP methyl ester carboxylesterase n=1 Tax=Rhodococcus rhodochrous J45 TaxID=935266 RepID=A0A562DKV0_RHORH|nr:alpha/beta fold hydrolase [Rhodococcus rhodochrous]TWH10308.1 pimeloyl-ACP methyl ester carboxylesterase [Rhodococcus rhodochrous J45]
MEAASSPEPTTFVLLHGGRHGGWCWKRVAALLRQGGHEVHTPTLTGLGDRAHLLNRSIGLDTHIQDLVATFTYEDLRNVVLVGHSYGGMVVSGAMEVIADRVKTVVLLDAHLPRSGESVFDLNGEQRAAAMVALADEHGDSWYIPPADASRYGVTDPADVAWANSRMTAQPLKTYQDRIGATDRMWSHPGMFIECVPSSLEPHLLDRARERSANDPRFHYRVLQTSHNAMVTDPDAVVGLLFEARDLAGTGIREIPSASV